MQVKMFGKPTEVNDEELVSNGSLIIECRQKNIPEVYVWPGQGLTWCQCSNQMREAGADRSGPAEGGESWCWTNQTNAGSPPGGAAWLSH